MPAPSLTAAVPPSLDAIPGLWRGGQLAAAAAPGVATGFPALDRELPGQGWPLGSLVEIHSRQSGIGELRLLAPALARLTQAGQTLFLITSPELARVPVVPNATAIAEAGIVLKRVIIVRPASEAETLWSLEQILRAGSPGAVVAWLERASVPQLRRLQVAAEGRLVAPILFRPASAADSASPAPLRLNIEPQRFRLAVHVFKRRGMPASAPVIVDLPQPVRSHRESNDRTQSAARTLGRPALPAAGHRPADARATA